MYRPSDSPQVVSLGELTRGGGSKNYPEWMQRSYEVLEFGGPGKGSPGGIWLDSLRVGMMNFPAGFKYPAHNHPAAEVYVLIAGSVRWRAGERDEVVSATACMYHPPTVEHAIEVIGEDPAAVLYVWWSDASPDDLLEDAKLIEP